MRYRLGFAAISLFASFVAASPAAAQSGTLLQLTTTGLAQRFRVDTAGGVLGLGTETVGTAPASGGGVRLMWYPGKAAFRAGRVNSTEWDDGNIGLHSFAAGLGTTASGDESVALGNGAVASGARSLAFHGNAASVGAMAMGTGAQATGDYALALGSNAVSSAVGTVAIGASAATGAYSVALGFHNGATADFSLALGKDAHANYPGSVVIGDGSATATSDSVYATANNQFVVRGSGGIRLLSGTGGMTVYTDTNLSTGVQLSAGGGSWSSLSDRNRKQNFLGLDQDELLERVRGLPVTSWNYIAEGPQTRHIGPMAQDWARAFHLSGDSLTINSGDFDGVNLAAIQALERRSAQQRTRIDEQDARIAALEQRIRELERLVQSLVKEEPAAAAAGQRDGR